MKRGKIKVKILSKFDSITAEFIAKQAGIPDASERIMEGSELYNIAGGVMCEKCNDRSFIATPQDTKEPPTSDYQQNTCECPLSGENARRDVLVNLDKFKEIIDDIDIISNCAPMHKHTLLVGLQ